MTSGSRKPGAEQKLLDVLIIGACMGEMAQGATDKVFTAGFNRRR